METNFFSFLFFFFCAGFVIQWADSESLQYAVSDFEEISIDLYKQCHQRSLVICTKHFIFIYMLNVVYLCISIPIFEVW